MKLINFFIITLSFVFIGCNDEDFWEVPRNGTNPSIECNVDGIDFKFCLLDKNGNPSTKFREGENFSFYLKITNLRKEELWYICATHYIQNFGDLKTLNHKTIKYPIPIMCDLSLGKRPLYGENSYEARLPWEFDHPDFNKVHIPKGKYYTEFSHKFKYVLYDNTTALSIGPLTFRVNFEIE